MQKLNRYIGRRVTAAILMVLVVIVGIDMLAELVNQLDRIRGDYTFTAALIYVALSVPASVYEYLPFAALIGCLAGLGMLAGNSELVVMRAAGISTMRLIWAAMKPAFILALLGLVLAEYVAPRTQQIAESHRSIAMHRVSRAHSSFGMWHREENRIVYLNAVQPGGVIYGITIYEFSPERDLQASVYASRASYLGDHWLLEDVSEARFSADQAVQLQHASQIWETELTPDLLNLLVLDPDHLAISGLWRYAGFLADREIGANQYVLAFWNKLLQPFTILALVLVAISFIFGPLRSVTMGFRVFIGVMVGIIFRIVQDMLGPASLVFGFSPIYASLLPILVCAAAGLALLMRRV